MAKLVIEIPAQKFVFNLSEENAAFLQEAWDAEDDWAWEDAIDNWISDVSPEMEAYLDE